MALIIFPDAVVAWYNWQRGSHPSSQLPQERPADLFGMCLKGFGRSDRSGDWRCQSWVLWLWRLCRLESVGKAGAGWDCFCRLAWKSTGSRRLWRVHQETMASIRRSVTRFDSRYPFKPLGL